jgi:hypothetical protein
MWYNFRWSWEAESEWEGSDAWRIDAARALGAIVCAYFVVGGIACLVGLVGVCKVCLTIYCCPTRKNYDTDCGCVLQRRLSNLRLFRDYSICDLAFGFTSTTLLTFASARPAVRSMLCEELSRQPDLLRSLSDSAGLNVENCESFFDKAVVGVIMVLYVVLFIRVSCSVPGTILSFWVINRVFCGFSAPVRFDCAQLLHSSQALSRPPPASCSSKPLW